MIRPKILVVEDDKHIAKLLHYNLEKAGFEVSVTVTGEEAFQKIASASFDLIILDVMLPKMDGFEVCKQIRQGTNHPHIPIIMLTARGEEIDKVVGFELGADDYVVKPFSPRELILRVKSILKRQEPKASPSKNVLEVNQLRIDSIKHKVYVKDKEVVLTSMEFKLLVTLVERRGRLQSRDQLLNDVWDMDSEVTTRTIDTHIKRLRQKLGKVGDMIETVRGHGYRFSDEE
jgi:DNA-binding response OmpR family regulator